MVICVKLSIIVPSYNEEGNLEELYRTIHSVLKTIDYEVIFVNDGSTDKTKNELDDLYNKHDKHVRVINFSRNFGKDAAIYAGLEHVTGEYCAIIDADMEQHPKYLLDMYNFLEENNDYDQVAMTIKKRKSGSAISRLGGKLFYKLINKLSDIHFAEDASDFRMFRSYVKDAILSLPEKNRFSKGIFNWVGFNTKYMQYDVGTRLNGKSKFTFKRSIKYAFEGIISHSTKPLRLATIFGIISAISGFVYLMYIVIKTIIMGIDTPGFPTIVCLIMLIGGIQLITIGILGEYIAKTYLEVKNRPIYIAKEKKGIKNTK